MSARKIAEWLGWAIMFAGIVLIAGYTVAAYATQGGTR